MDSDQVARWLIKQLSTAPPNEVGQNFITFRLAEWFPNLRASSGFGPIVQLSQTGVPPAPDPRHQRLDQVLRASYAELLTRVWIVQDQRQPAFCSLTDAGRLVAAGSDPDAERVAFAVQAFRVKLHPRLQAQSVDTHFSQGKFETALRDASTYLETAIRVVSGAPSGAIGVTLAENAFAVGGPLADPTVNKGEQTGLQRLFMGYFGAVRNRVAHQTFRFADANEALQLLLFVDYLTRRVDDAAKRLGTTLP